MTLPGICSKAGMAGFFRPRSCPVCGTNRGWELLRQEWRLFEDHPLALPTVSVDGATVSVYGLDSCGTCGAVYGSPIRDSQAYDRYYAEWSRYANGTDSLSGPPDTATLERFQGTVRLMVPHLASSQTRILDVGSLDGGLLREFRSQGYPQVAGVDPAPENSRRAALDGIDVRQGTAAAIPFPDGSFDAVLCVHILEHVPDLEKLDIFRVLAPRGRLYVEVPDATAYTPRSRDLFFDLSLEHINHFGPVALSNLLVRHGFRARTCGRRVYDSPGSSAGFQASIYGVFERDSSTKAASLAMDLETPAAVVAYVDESIRLRAELERRLAEFVARSGEIRLWGTGQVAFRLLGLPVFRKASITAITDSNPLYWGKRLSGVEVVPPDLFMVAKGSVLIASGLHGNAILSTLRNSFQWCGEVFIP